MSDFDLNFLQSELKRICGWIEFSDKKIAFISAYYSLVFGLAVSQKAEVIKNLEKFEGVIFFIYYALIICFIILFGLGMLYIIASVMPSLKNNNTDKSYFYYKNIAKMKYIDYLDGINELNEEKAKLQILEQIHSNSVIANKKMIGVHRSITCFIGIAIITVLLAMFY